MIAPRVSNTVHPFTLFTRCGSSRKLRRSFTIPRQLRAFIGAIGGCLALGAGPGDRGRVTVICCGNPKRGTLATDKVRMNPSLCGLLLEVGGRNCQVRGLPRDTGRLRGVVRTRKTMFKVCTRNTFSRFVGAKGPRLIAGRRCRD